MINVLGNVDALLLLEGYNKLEQNIKWVEYPNGKQAGLQYLNSDPWTDAVGRMKPEQKWTIDSPLNPFFKDTIFEELIKKYKLTRTRLMWLKPYSCYSMHKDDSPRIHLPLITDPNCYFVFKETGLTHLEAGKVYWVDTTKEHTFINCSSQWRLHLIGAC